MSKIPRSVWGIVLATATLGGCITLAPDEQAAACRVSGLLSPNICSQLGSGPPPSEACAARLAISPPMADYAGACASGRAVGLDVLAIRNMRDQFATNDALKAKAQAAGRSRMEADRAQAEAVTRAQQTKQAVSAENQKAYEEARKEIEADPRYQNRHKAKFTSFQDALEVLSPDSIPDSLSIGQNGAAAFMGAKGHVIFLRAQVMQVVDRNNLLVNPCYTFRGIEDMGMKSVCPIFVHLTRGCGGGRDLVDDVRFAAVAEVEGTMQYETALGTTRTVPSLVAYGVQIDRSERR